MALASNPVWIPRYSESQEVAQDLRQRARELLRREIQFVPNPHFPQAAYRTDPLVSATLEDRQSKTTPPADMPAHLRRMCQADLLTAPAERALFREMNYLKFRANALRSRIDPQRVDSRLVDEVEALLHRAAEIRDRIIQSNMRLVISVVKQFVTPQQSFDEMLSEGIFTLMQAVEKFDFDRGFRFSTYGYRSIARTAYRAVTTARREEARYTRDADEWAFEACSPQSASDRSDELWNRLRGVASGLVDALDRRERFIIRSRYALGSHRRVRTFQCLANKLGVSKERVRQIERRAVEKLRSMAAEIEVDEVCHIR